MEKTNLMFSDDFTADSGIWTSAGTIGRGSYAAAGGIMTLRTAFLVSKKHTFGVLTRPEYSGSFRRAVCDIKYDDPGSAHGFFLCYNTNGYYIARVAQLEKDGKSAFVFKIEKQFTRHTGLKILFESEDLSALGVRLAPGKWFNLDVSLVAGHFTVLIDGITVCEYTDEFGFFSAGQFGLRSSESDGHYKNLTVYGKIGPYRSMRPEPVNDPVVHDIDLSAAPGSRPAEFVEYPGVNDWKTAEKGGKPCLCAPRTEHAVTWIHAYEKDPVIEADFTVEALGGAARFGVFGRFGIEQSFVRLGYDADARKYFCEYREGPDFDTITLFSDKTFAFAPGNINFVARLNGGSVALFANGEEVFSADGILHTGWGRCGVFADDAALNLSRFCCRYPNGGKLLRGVVSTVLFPEEFVNGAEMERVDRDTVFAFMKSCRAVSHDAGATFIDVSDKYPQINPGGDYSSILHLKSGDFLQFNSFNDFEVERSSDMVNWKRYSQVIPPEGQCDDQGRRLCILHVSTPTELTMSDGHERIFLPVATRRYGSAVNSILGHYTRVFYSDDEGLTWQESKNDTRSVLDQPDGRCSWSESKVIRGKDGVLRMYYTRNQVGCVAYTSSYDEGETWSDFDTIPDMPCGMSSFGVCEDPTEPGTFFMVYVKNIPFNNTILFPRKRLVLVRTTDGVNWTELYDIDRFSQPNGYTESAELYQILDPSITVCDDYIYIGYGRGNGIANSYHNAQRARYVRIDRAAAGI